MLQLIRVSTGEEYEAAGMLFREYALWLNIDLSFQKFEEELAILNNMYAFPQGGIILCKTKGEYVGCVAVRKQDDVIAELKRMYVQPKHQRKGIGDALLQEAIILAKQCGYEKMRLDTLSNMEPAMTLYTKKGFCRIAPYYHNPQETAIFFEKTL